jgi:hypothetical protein
MTTFARIVSPQDLPAIGARESPTLDFKRELAPDAPPFEAAKDVAAMASAYGGVLLVGAVEDRATGKLVRWKPMALADAQRVVATVEQAAQQRCLPVPLVNVVAIPHPDGDFVVAVNVFPTLDQPVGVRTKGDPSLGWGDDAYVFPVRLSTRTSFLRPDQLAMLMNPEVRRVIILLHEIPMGPSPRVVEIHFAGFRRSAADVAQMSVSRFVLGDVILDENVVILHPTTGERAYTGRALRVPLDDIEAVWKGTMTWSLRLRGHFDMNPPGEYFTRARG